MRDLAKNVLGIMLVLLGLAAIVYGEIDDSPGLMLIGVILIGFSFFTLIKQLLRRSK